MRYWGVADVDGSCRSWTEVVFRGRKLHCGPWTEVVSHATPPHQVKVKINFEKQLTALHVVRTFHLFNWYVFILLTKMRTKTKTTPSMTGKVFWGFVWDNGRYLQCTRFPFCHDLIYFQRSGVCTLWFSHMCLILFLAYTRNRRSFVGKSEALLSWVAICLLFGWFYQEPSFPLIPGKQLEN